MEKSRQIIRALNVFSSGLLKKVKRANQMDH